MQRHFKTNSEERQTNTINATIHSLTQEICVNTCKCAVRKSLTDSTKMVLISLCYEYEFEDTFKKLAV